MSTVTITLTGDAAATLAGLAHEMLRGDRSDGVMLLFRVERAALTELGEAIDGARRIAASGIASVWLEAQEMDQ